MVIKGTGCFKSYELMDEVSADFTYTSSTYGEVMIASPDRVSKDEEQFIKNSVELFNRLTYDYNLPYQVIKSYQEEYPNVLKIRRCITNLITSDCRQLGVIWFDDGDIDVNQSLMNIMEQVNWDLSQEFDY